MPPRRVRIHDLKARKQRGEKIAVLTAYDASFARVLDAAARKFGFSITFDHLDWNCDRQVKSGHWMPDNWKEVVGGHHAPATQHDLWLWINGSSRDVVFEHARAAANAVIPFTLRQRSRVQSFFMYSTMASLSSTERVVP